MLRVFRVLFLANGQELVACYFGYVLSYQTVLPLFSILQFGVVGVYLLVLVSKPTCYALHAVIIVFGVVAVLVEVQVAVGVEHGLPRHKANAYQLAVEHLYHVSIFHPFNFVKIVMNAVQIMGGGITQILFPKLIQLKFFFPQIFLNHIVCFTNFLKKQIILIIL